MKTREKLRIETRQRNKAELNYTGIERLKPKETKESKTEDIRLSDNQDIFDGFVNVLKRG